MKKSLFAVATVGCVLASACAAPAADKDPVVVIETSLGTIKVELYQDKAPITVKNFLGYVDDKFYDGTIFHRVISDFMIQGGGFEPGAKEEKKTKDPIKNEASNGLSNERGTIAMARLPEPDSATAQFYINVKNNSKGLDKKAGNAGYCVFGRVIDGMEVVDKIKKVKTNDSDRPQEDVVIKSIRRAEK
jgi:cyclophilin family peptidyl-prolyl cis-trans isomerase